MSTFTAERALARRNRTGLNRQQFANKYHIPYRSVENWEKGTSEPPEYVEEMLDRLIAEDFPEYIHRVPVEELLADTGLNAHDIDRMMNDPDRHTTVYTVSEYVANLRDYVDTLDDYIDQNGEIITGAGLEVHTYKGYKYVLEFAL